MVRVKHHETQEPFAIKVVALNNANRTTFNTEVAILRQVRHPYITRLLGYLFGLLYIGKSNLEP